MFLFARQTLINNRDILLSMSCTFYQIWYDCNVNEQVKPGTEKSSSSEPQIRRDKAHGWIPNPRTPMNHFYSRVYESFFFENVTSLAISK